MLLLSQGAREVLEGRLALGILGVVFDRGDIPVVLIDKLLGSRCGAGFKLFEFLDFLGQLRELGLLVLLLSDHRTDGIDVLIEPLALLLDDPIVVGRDDRRVGAQGIGGSVYLAGEEVFHSAE